MTATNTAAKPAGRPFKESIGFIRKFSDGSRIEIGTDTANIKIAGFAPIAVTVYLIDKTNEIQKAEEKKFFGEKAKNDSTAAFVAFVGEVISGSYKFPGDELDINGNAIIALVEGEMGLKVA